jgi:hypothetical protein
MITNYTRYIVPAFECASGDDLTKKNLTRMNLSLDEDESEHPDKRERPWSAEGVVARSGGAVVNKTTEVRRSGSMCV